MSLVDAEKDPTAGASFHFLTNGCHAIRRHDASDCSVGKGHIHYSLPAMEHRREK